MDLRRHHRWPSSIPFTPHLRRSSRMVAAHGTPAVLAVWAARKEIVTDALADEFLDSLNFGLKNLDAICKVASAEMNLPEKELKLYLKTNIDYSLDDENRKGLLAYYSHAVKLGLLEKLNP